MPHLDLPAGRAPCRCWAGCLNSPRPGSDWCSQCNERWYRRACPRCNRPLLASYGRYERCAGCGWERAPAHFDVAIPAPGPEPAPGANRGHRATSAPPLADYADAKARAIAPYVTSPAELSESALQAEVEACLQLWGYWRRTPKNIAAAPPPKGWQVHLHQCRENPILLDVLLLGNDGRYLELELKTATGRATAEQRALLAGRDVCRSLLEVRRAVEAWETGVALVGDARKQPGDPR